MTPKVFKLHHTLILRTTGKIKSQKLCFGHLPPCLSGVMGLGSLLVQLHQAVLWKMAFHVLWMVEKQRKATWGAEDALWASAVGKAGQLSGTLQ